MGFIWLTCGLLTAWLLYHDKEKIPVVKAILVVLFGFLSLIVWALFHLGHTINNPMAKKEIKLEIVGRIKEKQSEKAISKKYK